MYYLGRGLQFIALTILPISIFLGEQEGGAKNQMLLLGAGVISFLLGHLICSRLGGAS